MFEPTTKTGRVWVAGVTLAISATAWAAMPTGGATAAAGSDAGCTSAVLPDPLRAAKVAKSKPAAFKTAARRNGMSVRALTEAATDTTLWLDTCGKQFFVEPQATAPVEANPAAAQPNTGVPLGDTFTLQSKPGAARTIYLDFNGGTVSNTGWNDGDTDIVVTPYSMDSTVTTAFSDAELAQIQIAWQVVAEDYAPFDVNVTTRDLGSAAIDRTTAADLNYGSHVYLTGGGSIYDGCGCGGVAYVGVIGATGSSHDYYQPAWVFSNGTGTSGKSMAEAASHEVGHNFGLDHDGTSTRGYYTGANPWAPIMGVGYSQPVVQWSTGEYPDANNKEDDLAIIAQNAPLRADDHGNNAAAATNLPGGSSVNGVISTRADVDAFKITGSGSTTVTLTGSAGTPNLDAKLTILDASGATVATVDPAVARVSTAVASGLDASWTGTLPAGGATYTVLIDGVGFGNPTTAGNYSDYGSLGNYEVALTTGTVATNTVTVTNPGAQTGTVGTAKSLQINASDSAAGQPLTYSATGLPAGLSINSSTGLISGTPTAAATSSTTVTVKDTTGATGTATFSWTINPATSSCSGQKLGNPGFETGTAAPWTASGGVIDNTTSQAARTGSWKAWLNGYGQAHTDKLSQTVTIPAGCKANLSFYLHIDTKEGTTQTQYDKLELRVGTTKVAGFSNLDAAAGYARRSYNLSVFAGQTVTITFTGTEDQSLKTSFVVDDAALNLS